MDLNYVNHCIASMNVSEFNNLRKKYLEAMSKKYEYLRDSLTGRRVRTKDQVIEIDIVKSLNNEKRNTKCLPSLKSWVSEENLGGIKNISSMCKKLELAFDDSEGRIHGDLKFKPIVIVAG